MSATELSIAAAGHAGSSLLTDFRSTVMMIPASQMPAVFAEFDERRDTFRDWLFSKLKRGVHYGVPPGCEPRVEVDPRQWVNKASLYKAGADFLCELMGWTPKYTNDTVTWEMLGKPPCVCMVCHLHGSDDRVFGQGRGARSRGEKKMADNATIKMAQKCAKVDAVINALSLSDLFTQDREDEPPDLKPNPNADKNAAKAKPRAVRVLSVQLRDMVKDWKENNNRATLEDWVAFVGRIVGRDFKVTNPDLWTIDEFEAVKAAVEEEMYGAPPY